MKLQGYVVSDLHMFSRRSEFADHMDDIREVAGKADLFVFNGDIFDFRWTTLPTVEETVDAAISWLKELIDQFPDCHFHFILGNHDNLQVFIDALSELTVPTPNLSWHPYYLRIGDVVFLHGDVSDGHADAAALERSREQWLHDHSVRRPIYHSIYDVVVRLGVHRAIQRVAYPKPRVARRLTAYLEDVGLGSLDGIRHVYFGHTHGAMQNYEYRDMIFHNPGAPIKGVEFNVLPVTVHAEPGEN
ncbi:MAG: metallophosphoesterase [Candidatus Hydrogenedentes bacterium]|nr:metallophosphoesterase [Candidatus Hydrogenedentota bacterium]